MHLWFIHFLCVAYVAEDIDSTRLLITFQPFQIQVRTVSVEIFQLSWEHWQAWLILIFVSASLIRTFSLCCLCCWRYWFLTLIDALPTFPNSGNNTLSGNIPTQLGALKSLYYLDFGKYISDAYIFSVLPMLLKILIPLTYWCPSNLSKYSWEQSWWKYSNSVGSIDKLVLSWFW